MATGPLPWAVIVSPADAKDGNVQFRFPSSREPLPAFLANARPVRSRCRGEGANLPPPLRGGR